MESPAFDQLRCALDAFAVGDASQADIDPVWRGAQETSENALVYRRAQGWLSWTLENTVAEMQRGIRS